MAATKGKKKSDKPGKYPASHEEMLLDDTGEASGAKADAPQPFAQETAPDVKTGANDRHNAAQGG